MVIQGQQRLRHQQLCWFNREAVQWAGGVTSVTSRVNARGTVTRHGEPPGPWPTGAFGRPQGQQRLSANSCVGFNREAVRCAACVTGVTSRINIGHFDFWHIGIIAPSAGARRLRSKVGRSRKFLAASAETPSAVTLSARVDGRPSC